MRGINRGMGVLEGASFLAGLRGGKGEGLVVRWRCGGLLLYNNGLLGRCKGEQRSRTGWMEVSESWGCLCCKCDSIEGCWPFQWWKECGDKIVLRRNVQLVYYVGVAHVRGPAYP
jgi:hypothetical protein